MEKNSNKSSWLSLLLGRPLKSSESGKEELSIATGVPVLGLDALASTGYGPEAALAILLPLGVAGLRYLPFIMLAVVAQLTMLYMSYRQTIAAYPDGGGAYIVAKDNLGAHAGVCAAASLLLDYLLNVAVGIAAGVGAVVSAVPALQHHTVALCLLVLASLLIVNLRGVRESGTAFGLPAFVFIGCMGIVLVIGLAEAWMNGGAPHAVVTPPPMPGATGTIGVWLMLGAFANGCTAMTGVEAVSNGVPLFRKPSVPGAQWTLTIIVAVLGLFLLGIGYLSPAYHIGPMDEEQPGYQTVISQLVAAVAGHGVFYYLTLASIFFILIFSSQTSFTDFPRVCRLLAEDRFLPSFFAVRGRRLVFSSGILVLTVLSGALLVAFGGITDKLIPLFAVGAFGAFLFSQAGMVVHWLRKGGKVFRGGLLFNALGAVTTAVALSVIVVAKFAEGAWVTVLVVPGMVWVLWRIRRHYERMARQLDKPVELETGKVRQPVVVIPVYWWNCVAEQALRFGMAMSEEITALHVTTEEDDPGRLRDLWAEKVEKPARDANTAVPRLEIVQSPYRQVYEPILKFVRKMEKEHPDRLIAVIIPELVEPHWYEYLLHNLHGAGLRALLFLQSERRTVVITTPWRLR